jgi:hypothetical protein
MRTRRFLVAGVLTLVCLVSAAPAAAAQPATAPPAEPVVASSCSAIVDGRPGQPVALDPRSVVEPIVAVLTPLDPLGVLVGPFRGVWSVLGPIPLGVVPEGQAEIPASRVADAVTARLSEIPLLGPVLGTLVPVVRDTLGTLCGLLVRGDQPGAPPAGTMPVAPGAPGFAGDGPSASERFAWRRAAARAVGGRGAVFGERPAGQAGPGAAFRSNAAAVAGPALDTGAQRDQSTRPASKDTPSSPWERYFIPILLAILLLTIVGARLVHRWALGARH